MGEGLVSIMMAAITLSVLLLTGRWFLRVDETISEAKVVNQSLKETNTTVTNIIDRLRDYNNRQGEK